MKRKSIKLVATSLLLSSLLSFSSLAAWEQQADGGWKYKDDTTNVYVTDRWIESATESGVWYYLDQNGIMATNTLIDNQYYVDHQGKWWEGNIHKEIGNLDDWDQGGGVNLDQDLLDRMEEGLNKIR